MNDELKNSFGHMFVYDQGFGSEGYRCNVCGIIVYYNFNIIISQLNKDIYQIGHLLDISCEEMQIKKLLE